MCEVFGIRKLNAYQREAIVQFVQKKTDVFVNLPTGYGKSLIYQALPFVYDSILEAAGHIVVVVSPLVNVMKDQVDKLANLGILAASLSEITEENAKGVVEGRFSIVYGRFGSVVEKRTLEKSVVKRNLQIEALCNCRGRSSRNKAMVSIILLFMYDS